MKMIPSEHWMLGLGAIYADGAGIDQATLGDSTEVDAGRVRYWLREELGLDDAEAFVETLDESEQSFYDATESADVGFYAMEAVGLARVGVAARWMEERRFWPFALPIARATRVEFSGWRQLAEAWLAHRAANDEFEVSESKAIDWLLGSSQSPWTMTPWESFDADDQALIHAVTLRIRVHCPLCGGTTPAGGVFPSLTCGDCLAEIAIGKEGWRDALGGRVKSVLYHPLGAQDDAEVHGDTLRYDAKVCRQLPKCPGCAGNMPVNELLSAKGTGAYHCSCGQVVGVRPADELAGSSQRGLVALVGEVPPLKPQPGSVQTELVPCHGCGAPLKITGTHRRIRCPYCRDATDLPDEVWRRIIPLPPALTFIALVDIDKAGAKSSSRARKRS